MTRRGPSVTFAKRRIRSSWSGRGVRLRYTFEVPVGLPQSEEPSDDYHKWIIRVQADVPGPDLDQVFEVPALPIDPPLQALRGTTARSAACNGAAPTVFPAAST